MPELEEFVRSLAREESEILSGDRYPPKLGDQKAATPRSTSSDLNIPLRTERGV